MFGLAGASAAGAAGLSLSACTTRPTPVQAFQTVQTANSTAGPPFVSRPDLTPPHITVRRYGVPSDPRYIFLNAPYSGPGHAASLISNHPAHLACPRPTTP